MRKRRGTGARANRGRAARRRSDRHTDARDGRLRAPAKGARALPVRPGGADERRGRASFPEPARRRARLRREAARARRRGSGHKSRARVRSTAEGSRVSQSRLRVVGIGASAGGLEAFKQILANVPADTGLAYVFVQHLDPTHPSMLSAVLQVVTKMPVLEVTQGIRVEPNRVYVIPPNASLELRRGKLRLLPRGDGRKPPMPADALFRSMAEDLRGRAIGVVLSGTASDGTMGLGAIKSRGGVTFAQAPATAKNDGMPQSAIAAGAADFISAPAAIAEEITALARASPSPVAAGARGDATGRILAHLYKTTGMDFSSYKDGTIGRRIARRVGTLKLKTVDHYARYLTGHPAEAQVLAEDLLIHVTEFFRDPEALSPNEELLSSNEELQSTNEELETAKEELQSANEELTTVNDELQSHNQELGQLNGDLVNVLKSVDIPIIILDGERKIRRFTPDASALMNLIPSDVGRPIGDIKMNLDLPDFEDWIQGVQETMAVKETEVRDRSGTWHRIQIRPYQTLDNRIDGVVITLVDIDALKRSGDEAKSARAFPKSVVDTAPLPLLIGDARLHVASANPAYYRAFGASPAETEGRPFFDLATGQWVSRELREGVEAVVAAGTAFGGIEVDCEIGRLGDRKVVFRGQPLAASDRAPLALL